MKHQLRNIEQRLREILIEPLQKSGQDRVEPLDLWTEMQKHLRAQITLNIAGVPVFPSRHVSLEVAVQDKNEQHRLQSVLSAAELRSSITEFLGEEGCRAPVGFWVSIGFVPQNPGVPLLSVHFNDEIAPSESGIQSVTLRVLSGQANISELRLSGGRTNLGRRTRVTDEHGGSARRNDLAFAERINGVNETVSRRHAHIDFDEMSGSYRIFRDSLSAETTVESRDGTLSEIPLGGSGVLLTSGDRIRLGRAEIEFIALS